MRNKNEEIDELLKQDNRTKSEKKIEKKIRENDLQQRLAQELFKKWRERKRDNGMYFD